MGQIKLEILKWTIFYIIANISLLTNIFMRTNLRHDLFYLAVLNIGWFIILIWISQDVSLKNSNEPLNKIKTYNN